MPKWCIVVAQAIHWDSQAVYDKFIRDRQAGISLRAIEQQFIQLAAAFGKRLVFVPMDNN